MVQGFPPYGPPPQLPPQNWGALPPAATAPSLGQLFVGGPAPGPGTYPSGPLPTGGPPPIAPMPGPAALGPGQGQGALGTGGVAGVGINPMPSVMPPALSGGPHPLPPMPPVPLPQGFPNPFEAGQPQQPPPGGAQPFSPGSTTTIGPQGYLPGLGYFGAPGAQGQQRPPTPQPYAAGPAPQPYAAGPAPQPYAAGPAPGFPTPQPFAAAAAPPTAAPIAPPTAAPIVTATVTPPAPQQPPSPFWTALAWQLCSTPAARTALGDRITRLLAGEERMKTIQAATNLLLTPELQTAFRGLATGSLQQNPFIALFAERLKGALDAARLAPVG